MLNYSRPTQPPLSLSLSLSLSLHQRIEETKKSAAAAAAAAASMSDFDFYFNDVIKVHPTKLNIPCVSNKDSYSCSIQLTNITDRMIVAYRIMSLSRNRVVVSRDEDTYVGTILPQSTCFVTVNGLKESRISSLYISAFPLRDGVKAEEITKENLDCKTFLSRGFFELPVVYYKVAAATAANSCSAVPEKNKNKSLLDDDNNLFHQSTNDEVHGTTSEGKGGSVSSVKGQSPNKVSSIVLFSDQEIKVATNGLSDSSKIGQGGYGAVYKGILHDTKVAIKMLDPNSQQGIDEFLQEMEVLGRMRHPNLVKLIGACVKLRALIYEFLPHGSLGDCLQKNPEILTWQIRTRIVYEICSALTFLHSIKPQPVVHGDLKPANILLDANFISKLADFGLCRFLPEGTTTAAFLDTKPKGTFGYIDPEFMRTGILTPCCDLYSFGVTILRLLTGMDVLGIVAKVRSAYKGKSLMTMVDPTAGQWPADVSEFLAYFGLKCCAKRKSPGLMKEIAGDLEEILAEIGVDAVSANMSNNKLTVVGSVDPLQIREYVGSKTGKKVDLISPQPTKKDEESSGPKQAQSDSKDQKKDDDKKPKPPVPTTVGLKIRLHCDGCIKKIRKNILRFEGVESVSVDSQKDLVTVKGTMNMKEVVPYLEEMLKRTVYVIAGEKKDDDGSEKKGNGNGNAGGEKKEKGGDDDTREKRKGDCGDNKEAAIDANKMVYHGLHRGDGDYYGMGVGYRVETVHEPPQMFSDENPNASCSVM